jgi:hypothetical protein
MPVGARLTISGVCNNVIGDQEWRKKLVGPDRPEGTGDGAQAEFYLNYLAAPEEKPASNPIPNSAANNSC